MNSINAVAGEPAFNLEAEINQFRAEIGSDPAIVAQEQAANDARSAQEVAEKAVVSAFDTGAAEYAEILGAVMLPGFHVLAPAWNVSGAQVEALAGAYGPLLQKYFPDGPSNFGPEIGAALVTVAILGPLMGKPRHKIEKPPEAANDPVHFVADGEPGEPGEAPADPGDDAGESALDPGEYGE